MSSASNKMSNEDGDDQTQHYATVYDIEGMTIILQRKLLLTY